MMNGLFSATTLSFLVHMGTGGGFYYWYIQRQPAPIVADLDLSMSPLMAQAPNPGGGIGRKSEVWTLPKKKGQKAPVPVDPQAVPTKEEVVKEEAQPCAGETCSETGTGSGGGGTGEGEGAYIPAENAFRKPRWIKNFITSNDYPLIARQQGKDGRVVLTVLIDADGRVRDARLLQGSIEIFNEVALRKIKDAVFSPAFDKDGRAVSCKATLPIRFELR